MKRFQVIILIIIGIAIGFGLAFWLVKTTSNVSDKDSQRDLSDIVSNVTASVVDIVISKDQSFTKENIEKAGNNDGNFGVGEGSGFCLEKDGVIATSNHLLAEGDPVVVLTDSSVHEANIIEVFPDYDLAFLKIDATCEPVIISENQVEQGDSVFLLGNSLGLYSHTLRTGVVSAVSRTIRKDSLEHKGVIQLDISVSKGDSGAPVFDRSGELQGMSFSFDNRDESISFTVPAYKIKELLNNI